MCAAKAIEELKLCLLLREPPSSDPFQEFLKILLPRMMKVPGVCNAYHRAGEISLEGIPVAQHSLVRRD